MTKKSSYNFFAIIIILVSVGFLGYYLSKSVGNQKNTTPASSSESTLKNQGGMDIKTSDLLLSGALIYANRDEKSTTIYKYDVKEKKSKVIFTDKDEEEKISYAESLTHDGKILIFMAQPTEVFIGNLYLIDTDGSGKKTKLVENFTGTMPLISPDGMKIAYTQFNNAEKDFGFKLIIANNDNTSKNEITKNDLGITLYSWSDDSNYIIASIGSQENETKIYSINVNNNEIKEIDSTNGRINSLNWQGNEIIFSETKDKDNSSQIYLLENNSHKNILDDKLYSIFPHLSKNNIVSYVSIEKNDTMPVIYRNGKIKIMDIFGKNSQDLADGNFIIGWLE